MTLKKPGWEGRLIKYISECSNAPFRPGRLDCGLFAGGAIKAMTGFDPTVGMKGKYSTIDKAMSKLADMGYTDHIEYAASMFEDHVSPLFACRGDLAVVEDMNGFPALGIVQGEYIYVMELNGIGLRPLTDAKRAFKI